MEYTDSMGQLIGCGYRKKSMRFPVLLRKRTTTSVVRRDFFERVGRLNEDSGQLDLNLARDAWIRFPATTCTALARK